MANYYFSDPEIINATIEGNNATNSASAIYTYRVSDPSLNLHSVGEHGRHRWARHCRY